MQTKIVQISDTHLPALGAKPVHHQQIRPEEKLRMVFDDIAQTRVRPDLIVLSGDLIHEGGVDDYAHLRQLAAIGGRTAAAGRANPGHPGQS